MIRAFTNADVPALADVWRRHWSRIGPPPSVTSAMIEQAILSRAFFDPAKLLLATAGDQIAGWCHWDTDPQAPDTAVISAICLADTEIADGNELLAAMIEAANRSQARQIQAGVVRDNRFGVSGLEPIGFGIGVFEHDLALTRLLSDAGFSAGSPAIRLVASTPAYRPPVSREALQLRRTTQLERQLRAAEDVRRASAMSHFDVETHSLLDRSGNKLAEVGLWCSDAEAEVMNSHHALLEIDAALQRGELTAEESFLISSLLQSLGGRHIFAAETVVEAEQEGLCRQLTALRFAPQDRGAIWTKSLG